MKRPKRRSNVTEGHAVTIRHNADSGKASMIATTTRNSAVHIRKERDVEEAESRREASAGHEANNAIIIKINGYLKGTTAKGQESNDVNFPASS